MANNDGRLLGLYDELSSFLTQINLYGSKGISDSHDTSTSLQWTFLDPSDWYVSCKINNYLHMQYHQFYVAAIYTIV